MRISDWSSDVCSSELRVVGGQSDEVVENARALRRIRLEGADLFVRLGRQLGVVVDHAHQRVTLKARHILSFLRPAIVNLLAEIERPVERRRVVVDQLRVGNDLADAVDHAGDLLDMRLFRRSEGKTAELQSLMRRSYAVFCLK